MGRTLKSVRWFDLVPSIKVAGNGIAFRNAGPSFDAFRMVSETGVRCRGID
jgi:hypothetical protein